MSRRSSPRAPSDARFDDGTGVRRSMPLRQSGAWRLAIMLGVLSSLSGPVGVVHADDVEALRAGLIEGSAATWPGRMETIGKSAENVGAVVGPLLRDRESKHLAAAAYAAAWLADHPVAGRVLLDEEIVERGGKDPAFVRELRRALSADGAGWARLVAVARELVLAPLTGAVTGPVSDHVLATHAASFLRHESTASNVRELLDVWDHAGDSPLGATARESLEAVLGASFDDPGSARRFLDGDRGRTLLDWVRELSMSKDRPDAPRFKRLLAEAAANLERVTTPDDLRPYLLSKRTPWPEVRRLAAARAKAIDPAAPGWTALFAESLAEETDVETLDALLRSFEGITSFDKTSAARLALDATRRLGATPPPSDGLSIGLLAVLGRLGTSDLLRGVVTMLMDRRASAPVLVAWLDGSASVRGLSAEIRALHRSRRDMTDADSSELRIRALGALARGGAETEGEAAANGSYLASILLGRTDGAPRTDGPEPDPARVAEERAAAARGLEAFPVKASIDALASRAHDAGEDVALVRLCASVLGRLAAKEAHVPGRRGPSIALDALIGVAGEAGVPAARISAIEDLARLATDEFEQSEAATRVMRLALDPRGPLDLRRAAARACAAAVDPLSLPGLFALVAEGVTPAVVAPPSPDAAPQADWALDAAEQLVRALARRDDASDDALGAALRDLLDTNERGANAAYELAKAAADSGGGRPALQETRARLLLRRARSLPRTSDERIARLEEGHRLLDAMLRGVAEGGAIAAVPSIVKALDYDVLGELLRSRVAQIQESFGGVRDDAVDQRRYRELEVAIGAAGPVGVSQRVLAGAIEAGSTLLVALRGSGVREIRRLALIDSARAELRMPRGTDSVERARGYLASAKELDPTIAERRDIARIEAELPSDGAPPPPK